MAVRHPKVRDDLAYFREEADDGIVYFVQDRVRGQVYRFNEFQVALMKDLDGKHSVAELAELLANQFETEVSLEEVERFLSKLERLLLLDVGSYEAAPERVHRIIKRLLRRQGLVWRGAGSKRDAEGVERQETGLFREGIRQIETGDACEAARCFTAVLEINPNNRRARVTLDAIHRAFFMAHRTLPRYMKVVASWNPDRLLGALDRVAGKLLFNKWTLLFVIGFFLLSIPALVDSHLPPASSYTWKDLALAFIPGLVFLFGHEASHGLACKHYGGRVDEMGLMLMYGLAPAAYCDISESHRFPLRKKIVILAAGTVAQVFLTSAATFLYHYSAEGLAMRRPLVVAIAISYYSIFTNILPLIPLDGYFALADYLKVGNLRERSFRYVAQTLQRRILGIRADAAPVSSRERKIFLIYGLSAAVYTAAYVYGLWFSFLLPLLVQHLHGVGFAIAMLFSYRWVVKPLVYGAIRLTRLLHRHHGEIFTLRRSLALSGVGLTLLVILAYRWPLHIAGEILVEPGERLVLRASEPGLVEEVAVEEGDRVHVGQVVARLRDDELARRRSEVAAQVAQARLRVTLLRQGARPEEIRAAVARAESRHIATAFAVRDRARAASLKSAALASESSAMRAESTASRAASDATVASLSLRQLRAGTRQEDVAQGEAVLRGLEAKQSELAERWDRLTLRSPIEGVVVGTHLRELLYERLGRGDAFCEIHNLSRIYAEVRLPLWESFASLAPGQAVLLRAYGDPNRAVKSRVRRIEPVVQGRDAFLVVHTDRLPNPGWRAGMSGRGRIYGPPRSVAYQLFGIPLLQILDYKAWSLRGA